MTPGVYPETLAPGQNLTVGRYSLDFLSFRPEGHRYVLSIPGEEMVVLPSISQILKSEGYYGEFYGTIEEQFANMRFGSDVALATALYDQGVYNEGDLYDLDPDVGAATLGWVKFRRESGFTPYPAAIERPLYHPTYRYGGTPDRAGTLRGTPVVVEIKTGGFRPGYMVQVAGQAELLRIWRLIPTGLPVPGLIVTLKTDSTFSQKPIPDAMALVPVFLSALTSRNWKKNNL